jgi:hypothetical protein
MAAAIRGESGDSKPKILLAESSPPEEMSCGSLSFAHHGRWRVKSEAQALDLNNMVDRTHDTNRFSTIGPRALSLHTFFLVATTSENPCVSVLPREGGCPRNPLTFLDRRAPCRVPDAEGLCGSTFIAERTA